MPVIVFGDIVEKNGKTIRENNRAIPHNYKEGDLVEVKMDDWHGDGACSITRARLFIVHCGRDCDGTPLYWLSPTPRHKWDRVVYEIRSRETGEGFRTKDSDEAAGMTIGQKLYYHVVGGFSEESLKRIAVNDAMKDGYGGLAWGNRLACKFDQELVTVGGFENELEFKALTAKLDRKTPGQLALYQRWYYRDGTKAGLLALIESQPCKNSSSASGTTARPSSPRRSDISPSSTPTSET